MAFCAKQPLGVDYCGPAPNTRNAGPKAGVSEHHVRDK